MSFIRNLLSGDSDQSSASPARDTSSNLLGGMAAGLGGALLGPVVPPLLGPAMSLLSGGSSNTGGSPSFPGGGSVSAPDSSASEEEVQQYISLIVRGKNGEDHNPGVLAQHADVILSNGAPSGFFGEGGGRFADVGMGMDGVVADEDWFSANRPGYIDGDQAAADGTTSTVLQIPVTADQAQAFDQYWADLAADPGAFNLLGDNCSTHAAEAFAAAGLIDGGIDGMDTPDNLYGMLSGIEGATSESGFLDFDQASDGTWTHSMQTNPSPYEWPQTWHDGSSAQSSGSSIESSGPASGSSSRAAQ